MEKVILELPQLILVARNGYGGKYLERFAAEANEPKSNLIFQEDSREDPRIIIIKYNLDFGKLDNNILYYSEENNKHGLITFNLGYGYIGRVLVRDYNGHKMGFSLEHLPKEGLRKRHLERINELNDIIEDLTPEYVAERYKDLFYNLQKFYSKK